MRLAIISSHPIQYNSPWFRFLTINGLTGLRVFYLWDGGVTEKLDRGFGVKVKWDIPLLNGYEYEFVPNRARQPGPGHWCGLDNPTLSDRLAAFQPDAILLFGYNYLTHYRLLLSQWHRRIPLLFRGDSHRLIPEHGLLAGLRRSWIQFVFRRFAAFIFVGKANREYFKLHGVPENKLFFSPHSVDNERFINQSHTAASEAIKWKLSLGIQSENKVILFAGKFETKKRPRDLVAAFKLARLERTTLLLVGSGELESALRQDAAGHSDIVFAPFQNQTQMPRTYAAADVFVLPSYGRGETWGLAVNEAMCMGRPIIVSDHVGCAQDLVQPQRNGLIFPAGDVLSLAAALTETLNNSKRLNEWGAQSREIIIGYDYEHATRGLLASLDFVTRGKLKH